MHIGPCTVYFDQCHQKIDSLTPTKRSNEKDKYFYDFSIGCALYVSLPACLPARLLAATTVWPVYGINRIRITYTISFVCFWINSFYVFCLAFLFVFIVPSIWPKKKIIFHKNKYSLHVMKRRQCKSKTFPANNAKKKKKTIEIGERVNQYLYLHIICHTAVLCANSPQLHTVCSLCTHMISLLCAFCVCTYNVHLCGCLLIAINDKEKK